MNNTLIYKTTILAWLTAALVTGEIATADFYFGRPQNLGPVVNSASNEAGITLSSDGLELYFGSERSGGEGGYDIWVSTRPSVDDAWGPPTNLGAPVNSPYTELYPCLSSDGLTLYFSDYYSGSPRPGGLGGGDIWMTTRASRSDPWTTPVNLGAPVNTANLDMSPTVSADGLTLAFNCRDRAGGYGSWDMWMSTRSSVDDPWGQPVNLGSAVNSGNWEGEGGLSADGRALVFGSGRAGIVGGIDLWMTTRRTLADPWMPAVNAGTLVNSNRDDGTARFSPDMRTLYFCSDRSDSLGGYDLYAASILPIVDLNGNGAVDTGDILRMIESWGQSDPMVDIGPVPWGDGTVDAADLEVLMSYWGQETADPTLLAHWAFDETEGIVAYDSAGGNDGMILGLPQWRPEGGVVDGTLELNGMTFVTADSALSPADGPFSVLAWVKGGAPGQAIISQGGGVNWLMTDADQGGLMTELSRGGRTGAGLLSQTTITDGNWHRIAVAWDGANRRLHVDGVLVAEDPQDSLAGSSGKLLIGCGKTMAPGTFWSGLIDDVRIYNRVMKP